MAYTTSTIKRSPIKVDNWKGNPEYCPNYYHDSVMDDNWWFTDDKGNMVHKGMFNRSKEMMAEKSKYPHIFGPKKLKGPNKKKEIDFTQDSRSTI